MTTTFIKNDIRSIELWTVKHEKKMQTLISYKSKKELIFEEQLKLARFRRLRQLYRLLPGDKQNKFGQQEEGWLASVRSYHCNISNVIADVRMFRWSRVLPAG